MLQTQIRLNNVRPPDGQEKWTGRLARSVFSDFIKSSQPVLDIEGAFHHLENGKLSQSYPVIRYEGGKHGWGITFLSGVDSALMANLISGLAFYAIDHEAVMVTNNLDSGITLSDSFNAYRCSVVVGRAFKKGVDKQGNQYDRSPREYNKRLLTDEDFREEELKWSLTKGIVNQLVHYVSLGEATLADVALIMNCHISTFKGELNREAFEEFMSSILIEKMDVLSPEKKQTWLPRFYVEFSLPYTLKGSWSFGRMTHKGHGRIYPKGRFN